MEGMKSMQIEDYSEDTEEEQSQEKKDTVIIKPSDLQAALDSNKVTFVE